jgi:hypothetical protein
VHQPRRRFALGKAVAIGAIPSAIKPWRFSINRRPG